MFFGRDRRAIRTILIVEDEPLVAFDNEHMLTHAGYDVVDTVDSYEDAAEALEREAPDLVVADVQLTGAKSGIDVAALANARSIPLLFVTGNCPAAARHLAVGCLAKPYAARDLVQALRALDRKSQGKPAGKLPPGLTLYEAGA